MAEGPPDPVLRVDLADDGIATLTVDRPQALNALNSEVLAALGAALGDLRGKVRGILVTGAGEKAFVAGADIAEMAEYGSGEAEAFSRRGHAVLHAMQDFPAPVVAAVNGYALGGGLELALACDIIVASDQAKLGLPEATLAVVPGFGGTQTLPRRVGPGQAKRLLFTGQPVDAAEALRIGLADVVVPHEQLLPTARAILEKSARNGPLAVAAAKRLVAQGAHHALIDALALEAEAFGAMFATADQKAGMRAFLEKTKPTYHGK